MRKLILAYLKFWWRSKNQHGVHSPFVYDLITKCFYDKQKTPVHSKLKSYREALLKNTDTIEVTDLGAGSQVTKSNTRVISNIAKSAGTTPSRARLFYRLVNYFQFGSMLELGTSLGIATYAMHLGNPKGKITSIEGCPNISAFTRQQLKDLEVSNVDILTGDFSEVLSNLSDQSFDFVYFDGNHQKEATIAYFETMLASAHNDTVFVFDDIYWSKGMTEAWNTIIDHPHVTVSIDTFFWGFVFFRNEQKKEHFTIRV